MNSRALRNDTFGEPVCALADPDHDDPPPHPELSCEEDDPEIQSRPEAEEPTIEDGGEICIPALFSFPVPAQLLADLSETDSILAIPSPEVSLEEIEARLIRAFAFESIFDHLKLRWAHGFGRLLIAYKHRVGHGNFESSLVKNVLGPGRSRSTVGDCMQIASVDLDELLSALDSQNSGNPSISSALEYLRRRDDGRSDRRRRSHQDRRVVSARRPSPPSARRDGAEGRSVGLESQAGGASANQLKLDEPDEPDQTRAAPKSPPHDSSVASAEPDDRSAGDTEVNPVDQAKAPVDPGLVAKSSRAADEMPPGPIGIATSPPTPLGDESGVMTSFSPEVRATIVVEKPSETAAAIDILDTPSDQDWLDGLAVRSRLTRTDAFDREALTWRHQHLAVQEMVASADLSTDERAQISPRTRVARGYRSRLAYAAAVLHPGQWLPCYRCHGRGTSVHGPQECSVCDGTCFEVTQIGTNLGASASSDGPGT